MRRCALFFAALLCALAVRGADIPSVLVLGDDPRMGGALERRIAERLEFYPVRAKARVTFRCVEGVEGALEALGRERRGRYRVLLLCLGDGEEHPETTGALLRRARALGMEPLWFGRDGDAVAQAGACVADYEGACRQLAADDMRRRIDYIAEATAQWWTGIARSNRGIERIPLWSAPPPDTLCAGPEYINALARIDRISEPELELFLPRRRRGRVPAVLFFPGGGYSFTGFVRNAREAAELLARQDIAVVGVKYRVKRGADVALDDARRAVRLVRSRAAEWGIDPAAIGVAGQSAGANIVLNLSTRFLKGDPAAADPVERCSSRPDFVAPLTVWHFGRQEYPFAFGPDTPPFFVRQARNDSSFALAERMVGALRRAGVATDVRFVDEGGHGAFEIEGPGGGHDWPAELAGWLRRCGFLKKNEPKKR